jgi:hypothetical protein
MVSLDPMTRMLLPALSYAFVVTTPNLAVAVSTLPASS